VLEQVRPKHIVALSDAYGLDAAILADVVQALEGRREAAKKAVAEAAKRIGQEALGNQLVQFMEKRWNGSFKSIGPFLSKKR
jgi:hypothetical protein